MARIFIGTSSLLAVLRFSSVSSFSPPSSFYTRRQNDATTSLSMAGAGMGMGMGVKSKKNNKKGSGKKPNKDGGSTSPHDVGRALLRSEKLYDELMAEAAKVEREEPSSIDEIYGPIPGETMDVTTEYIIAARGKQGASLIPKAATDWVPVAQICLVRSVPVDESETNRDEHKEIESAVQAAVSYYCREINYIAARSAPSVFGSLPRNNVEYSVEPIDSFFQHVYEDVIEGRSNIDSENNMSKSTAREILGLDAGCKDASLIKQAYKKMSMVHHPDRIANKENMSQNEIDEASKKFLQVKMAYESLNSGVRGEVNTNGFSKSWYESLGGKARSEFMGPIELMSVEKASALCNKAFKSAVVGIDPDLTMSFVARNQASQ